MYVKGYFGDWHLYRIAEKLGVEVVISDIHKGRDKKNVISFRLFPIGDKFRRKGYSGRRVNAVCYHGYTKFLEEVQALDKDTFENKSQFTGNKWSKDLEYDCAYRNIGSIISPLEYGEACFCD